MKKCWPAEMMAVPQGSRSSKKAVQRYCDLWRHYTTELWPAINQLPTTPTAKTERASLVVQLGKKFSDLWTEALGDSKQLYMHLLLCHLPDQIRDLPVDPYYLQTQSLEHLNKIRKRLAKEMSNWQSNNENSQWLHLHC
jgi:predicted MPP superfamily phosphohydrolase